MGQQRKKYPTGEGCVSRVLIPPLATRAGWKTHNWGGWGGHRNAWNTISGNDRYISLLTGGNFVPSL